MPFTDTEKRALEVFVTSTDDPIYAVRHTLPPEMFGAFGSYFSRNPKDFREHLLDAIYGRIKGYEIDPDIGRQNIERLGSGDFDDPSEFIKTGLERSQDFYRQWYGGYSHKSIANTVWIPMVATNVSQLFAKELAFDQLAFFIEQSTRYVPWTSEDMFHDSEIMDSEHAEVYQGTLDESVKAYHILREEATRHYEEQIPFNTWLEWQSEQTRGKEERIQKAKYNREIRGAALDVARFSLPQAAQTNIAWILDARSTEFDIAAWKGHPLQEIVESAELIEKHAGEIAPSLLKYTERSDYYSERLNNFGGIFDPDYVKPFEKGIDVVSSEKDALNKTIGHLLKRHSRGGTFRQRYEEAQRMGFKDKIAMLDRMTQNRGSHDEWVEMDEDFDLTRITFAIRTDLGAIRDWRRHQKWDRGEALYTLDNGVHKPAIINEIGGKAAQVFDDAMEVAYDAEFQIRRDFPFQAQYVVPMATMHEITMSAGLDQLQYMVWTRSTPEGNFSYREDAFNIAESILRIHPWLFGYEKYPEGKSLEEISREAPLKGLLKLQFGETALHT